MISKLKTTPEQETEYKKIIHSRKWQKIRASYLSKHPCCERCATKGLEETAAKEVHHIIPLEGLYISDMRRLAFDPSNLIALCHSCHQELHRELDKNSKESNRKRNKEKSEAFNVRFFGE